jgi:hypothetical protein
VVDAVVVVTVTLVDVWVAEVVDTVVLVAVTLVDV